MKEEKNKLGADNHLKISLKPTTGDKVWLIFNKTEGVSFNRWFTLLDECRKRRDDDLFNMLQQYKETHDMPDKVSPVKTKHDISFQDFTAAIKNGGRVPRHMADAAGRATLRRNKTRVFPTPDASPRPESGISSSHSGQSLNV